MKTELSISYQYSFKEKYSLNYSAFEQRNPAASMKGGDGSSLLTEDLLTLNGSRQNDLLSSRSMSLKQDMPSFTFSPDVVAQNVLRFVERRIEMAKVEGADLTRLGEMLDAAKEGVALGMNQAREDLTAMGLLSEELDGKIDQSLSLTLDGLDRFQERYATNGVIQESLGTSVEDNVSKESAGLSDQATEQSNNDLQLKDQNMTQVDESGEQTGFSFEALKASAFSHSSSEFQLKTQDGDIVSISFSNKQAFKYAAYESVSEGAFKTSFREREFFSFEVSGQLDEQELVAINELLQQIVDVSESFFSGDIGAAFDSALSIGFDGREIAEFSLDLSISQITRIEHYGEGSLADGSNSAQFSPLAYQAGRVVSVLERMAEYMLDKQEGKALLDHQLLHDALKFDRLDVPRLSEVSAYLERLMP